MSFHDYFFGQIVPSQYLDFFIRIIVACVCGAAIGFERSRRLKNAGLRTHIMVCCASALMMIVSKYGFADLVNAAGGYLNGTNGTDPARIAAQVISGISFLGAGVIFKHGASIKGLTTAAGIWATAGIGLAIGAGMYIIGLFSMIVVVVVQYVMHKFNFGVESWSDNKLDFHVQEDGTFQKEFLARLENWNTQLEEIEIDNDGDSNDGKFHYEVVIKTPSNFPMEEIVQFFANDSRIIRFSVIPNV